MALQQNEEVIRKTEKLLQETQKLLTIKEGELETTKNNLSESSKECAEIIEKQNWDSLDPDNNNHQEPAAQILDTFLKEIIVS